MTWEWVVLVSLSMLIATGLTVFFFERKDRLLRAADVNDLRLAVEKVVEVQNKITSDMAQMNQIAQETKKTLSDLNLASAFKPRAMR